MNIDTFKTIEVKITKTLEEVKEILHAAGITEIPSALNVQGFELEVGDLGIDEQIQLTQEVYKKIILSVAPFFVNYRDVLLTKGVSVSIQENKLKVEYNFNKFNDVEGNVDVLDVLQKAGNLTNSLKYEDLLNEYVNQYQTLEEVEGSESASNYIFSSLEKNLKARLLVGLDFLKTFNDNNDEILNIFNEVQVFAKKQIQAVS